MPDRAELLQACEDCTFCGGLHFGTPPGKCPYRCATCGGDIRDGGHVISPTGKPAPICPLDRLYEAPA